MIQKRHAPRLASLAAIGFFLIISHQNCNNPKFTSLESITNGLLSSSHHDGSPGETGGGGSTGGFDGKPDVYTHNGPSSRSGNCASAGRPDIVIGIDSVGQRAAYLVKDCLSQSNIVYNKELFKTLTFGPDKALLYSESDKKILTDNDRIPVAPYQAVCFNSSYIVKVIQNYVSISQPASLVTPSPAGGATTTTITISTSASASGGGSTSPYTTTTYSPSAPLPGSIFTIRSYGPVDSSFKVGMEFFYFNGNLAISANVDSPELSLVLIAPDQPMVDAYCDVAQTL
jgi:hypothetical protein